MSDVVKVVEVLAQSPKSWEDAAICAVKKAQQTLRNVKSIYIKEFDAKVTDGEITHYRINAKISFALET